MLWGKHSLYITQPRQAWHLVEALWLGVMEGNFRAPGLTFLSILLLNKLQHLWSSWHSFWRAALRPSVLPAMPTPAAARRPKTHVCRRSVATLHHPSVLDERCWFFIYNNTIKKCNYVHVLEFHYLEVYWNTDIWVVTTIFHYTREQWLWQEGVVWC